MPAELDPFGERLVRLGERVASTETLACVPDVPVAPRGTPIGLLVEVSDALDADLETLDHDAWNTPVLFGWSVRGMVLHLAAVHGVLIDRLAGRSDAAVTTLELDDATDRAFAAGRDLGPEATRALWRDSVIRLRRGVATCDAPINWLGLVLPAHKVIVDRAFETWIHANDIRRATNRASLDPSGEHLKVLSDLAVELLPLALEVTARPHDAVVTVNLAGPGGGTWIMPLGRGAASGIDVVFNASARELCLLLGDRIDPADFAYTVRGDAPAAAIVRDLVDAAPVFARA